MPQPFEEQWNEHIELVTLVRPCRVLAICVKVFQVGASISFGHISGFQKIYLGHFMQTVSGRQFARNVKVNFLEKK